MIQRVKLMFFSFLVVATLVLATASLAFCGVILYKQIYRVVSGGKGSQLLDTWEEYYQDNKIAVYQRNAIFVIDIKNESLINIIPSRKIYAMNTVQDFISRIKKIIKEVKMQPMFNQNDNSCKSVNVTVKMTGEKRRILGYPSVKYEVYANGVKKREVWIAQIIPLTKEVDFDKTMKLKFRIENILTPLSECKDIETDSKYRKLFVSGNIPMLTIDYLLGRKEVERVVKIEVLPISKKIFEPPEGFRKVPIEKFMQH